MRNGAPHRRRCRGTEAVPAGSGPSASGLDAFSFASHDRNVAALSSGPLLGMVRRPRAPHRRAPWEDRVVTSSRPQTIAYPAPSSRPYGRELEPLAPHVIVLFGATGDLAK